jgi:hypothetical protein
MLDRTMEIPALQSLLAVDTYVREQAAKGVPFSKELVRARFDAQDFDRCMNTVFKLYHEAGHFVFGFLGECPGNFEIGYLTIKPSRDSIAHVGHNLFGPREPINRYVYANGLFALAGRWCEEVVAEEFCFDMPTSEAKSDFQSFATILEEVSWHTNDQNRISRMVDRLEWLAKKVLKEPRITKLVNNIVWFAHEHETMPASVLRELATIHVIDAWQ